MIAPDAAIATRVPYEVYFDADIYAREQERIFRGPHWTYVALDSELPNPKDFKTSFLGDTPIVVTRAADGELHAFINKCAHRGALVCREPRGNKATHQCVYHQWSYDLAGNLIGVPFRRGIEGKGGYGPDFDTGALGLTKLRVDAYSGLIFVTADPEVESLFDYIGPQMRPWIDRVYRKPTRILGYTRQFVRANWKLYAENIRDPYHASLLHLFHTTFGIYRSSQGGGIILDETGRHSFLRAFKRTEAEETESYKAADLRTYKEEYSLEDPSLLRSRAELTPELTNSIQTIFPGLVLQQIANTLATRQIVPKGPNAYELIFTYFGYADDDDEIAAIRLKQANLVGPGGYISMEDGYATEIVQQGIVEDRSGASFMELGGTTNESDENLITEASLRAFWTYYNRLMDIHAA
jgi:anthranilate 1,2-dioxygenase large subunit